jgi:phosphomannomutase
MLVEYGIPLSAIIAHLEELVGPHAYARHDIAFPRDGYEERKAEIYKRMQASAPETVAGVHVVRIRDDDGFKFYLEDGSWVLMRMSGTEPLMRVYAEAPTSARVDELLAALEQHVGAPSRQPAGAPQ